MLIINIPCMTLIFILSKLWCQHAYGDVDEQVNESKSLTSTNCSLWSIIVGHLGFKSLVCSGFKWMNCVKPNVKNHRHCVMMADGNNIQLGLILKCYLGFFSEVNQDLTHVSSLLRGGGNKLPKILGPDNQCCQSAKWSWSERITFARPMWTSLPNKLISTTSLAFVT